MLTDVRLQHYSYWDEFVASTRQIYTVCARVTCLELTGCDAGGPAQRATRAVCCCLRPRRSSGFDVREACVGLAAAGWGAQVPRAAALWERCAEITKSVGNFNSTVVAVLHTVIESNQPELVSDWQDLDFPMRDRRLAAVIMPSLEVLRLRTSLQDHTYKCMTAARISVFIPCKSLWGRFLTTVHRPPSWSAPASPHSWLPAPECRPSHSQPSLCIFQHAEHSRHMFQRRSSSSVRAARIVAGYLIFSFDWTHSDAHQFLASVVFCIRMKRLLGAGVPIMLLWRIQGQRGFVPAWQRDKVHVLNSRPQWPICVTDTKVWTSGRKGRHGGVEANSRNVSWKGTPVGTACMQLDRWIKEKVAVRVLFYDFH